MLYSIHYQEDTLFVEKIDPVDGALTKHEIKSGDFDSHTRISPSTAALYGDKLYFTDNRWKSACSIGVIDLNTLK